MRPQPLSQKKIPVSIIFTAVAQALTQLSFHIQLIANIFSDQGSGEAVETWQEMVNEMRLLRNMIEALQAERCMKLYYNNVLTQRN